MNLADKAVALHRSLEKAGVPHAFGGALALAYFTLDPRGTSDIDLNIFVPAGKSESALAALPHQVQDPDGNLLRLAESGQARLWWGENPVDLFFNYLDLHDRAARNSREVPFEQGTIPILGPVELAVFKVMFDRTRDWADLEAMVAAGTLEIELVAEIVTGLVGADDARIARLGDLAS